MGRAAEVSAVENSYRAAIQRAQAAYADYLEAEVKRVLAQVSRNCKGGKAEFVSGMGDFYFMVGDDREYIGFGAGRMLERLAGALDEYGWSVIPGGWFTAENGELLPEKSS